MELTERQWLIVEAGRKAMRETIAASCPGDVVPLVGVAVTRIDLFVDDADAARQSFVIKQFQIKPFIVDAGKILTKEFGASDNTTIFNPSEIFKTSDKNSGQTMNLKLRAGFWLLTPDGSIFTSIDLHSELALPPSGAAIEVKGFIFSAERTTRVSPTETLYHHRSFRVPW